MSSSSTDLSIFFGKPDDTCAICLEKMPVLSWRGNERSRTLCCSQFLCQDCGVSSFKHQLKTRNQVADAFNRGDMHTAYDKHKEFESATSCPLCRCKLPSSDKEAFEMRLERAKKGCIHSQHAVGTKYESGKGTRQDMKQAAKWFKLAAENGHPWSQSSYGHLLETGDGVAKNIAEAKKFYEKSIAFNQPQGYQLLATMYENGIEVAKDEKEAVRLYRVAAEMGYDISECSLGYCYDYGIGVAEDPEEALKWYLCAAKQGTNETAMNNAGVTMCKIAQLKYGRCDVVGKSPLPRAVYWAKKAARLGNMDSTIFLQQIEAQCQSVCANCNASAVMKPLSRCGKCKVLFYCGKTCQSEHWKAGHKLDCVKTDE